MSVKRKPPAGEPLPWFDWEFQPTKNVCICSRCMTVAYPVILAGGSSVYRCCNQIWTLQIRVHSVLPYDFWDRYTWGNKVPKGYREPDDVADTGETHEEGNAA
jgi:hypothetical protein